MAIFSGQSPPKKEIWQFFSKLSYDGMLDGIARKILCFHSNHTRLSLIKTGIREKVFEGLSRCTTLSYAFQCT